MFHARWFIHSSQTVLREAAGTQELLLTDECDDNPVECIIAHARVHYLGGAGQPVQPSFNMSEARYQPEAEYATNPAADFFYS